MYAQLYESNKACNRKQMVSYTGSPSAVTQAHGMQHVDAGYSCVVQHWFGLCVGSPVTRPDIYQVVFWVNPTKLNKASVQLNRSWWLDDDVCGIWVSDWCHSLHTSSWTCTQALFVRSPASAPCLATRRLPGICVCLCLCEHMLARICRHSYELAFM